MRLMLTVMYVFAYASIYSRRVVVLVDWYVRVCIAALDRSSFTTTTNVARRACLINRESLLWPGAYSVALRRQQRPPCRRAVPHLARRQRQRADAQQADAVAACRLEQPPGGGRLLAQPRRPLSAPALPRPAWIVMAATTAHACSLSLSRLLRVSLAWLIH